MYMLNLFNLYVSAYPGYLQVTKTNLSNLSPVPSRHHDTFSSLLQQFLVLPEPRTKLFDTM